VSTKSKKEGFIAVPGGRVWYQSIGNARNTPLVVLHGGPGYPHDYLEPLAELADRYRVIFYDQLGCGKSERPSDPGLWRIERFVDELSSVCKELKLRKFHLLGHSWGTIVAVEYALLHPDKLLSLVLASPCLSIPRWVADAAALRKLLPDEVRRVLDEHEQNQNYYAPAYFKATAEYYRCYVCRIRPKPEPVQRSDAGAGGEVYTSMWGPNEFCITGSLAHYDCTAELSKLSLPVFFTCGRLDEAQPETTQYYQNLIPGAQLRVFENSSHTAHWEDKEKYLQSVRDFLDGAEPKKSLAAILKKYWDSSFVCPTRSA
jgi:proline iminopeptidase